MTRVLTAPPQGVVTLMFTDVEGSTTRWEQHPDQFGEALQVHDRLIRQAVERFGGYEVKTVGDSFMVAFGSASDAIRCAAEIQAAFAEAPAEYSVLSDVGGVRVRIGIHTGEPIFRDNDYFGPPVNRASRIADAGLGGMTVVSQESVRRADDHLDPEFELVDQGLHSLKDLGQPERLFVLSHPRIPERPFTNLRTLEALPHNFPAQVTSFVGRVNELEELTEILRKPSNRLITMTGPGGTGKTRLAMQVAVDRLQDFPGGLWFVELQSVRDTREVATAIALALNIQLMPNADPARQVADFLQSRRCLLLLDNFEQVADAAPLVGDLLRDCSGLTVLVTSRELLRLSGEQEYPVEPLSVPPANRDENHWIQFESVQLFVERCRSLRPDFTLTNDIAPVIGEICRKLDGIPLAIELAAARVRGMTPSQILQRLSRKFDLLASGQRDLPERQRALRSTIDWSYDLLTEDERALFAELAVFNGGFFIEAAENVCTVFDVFNLVFSLRDKSLLKTDEVAGEQRYTMLETLREYATERLIQAGKLDSLRDNHADHYLKIATDWGSKLERSSDADQAMLFITVDIDNMRAGMDRVVERQDHRSTIDYATSLARFFLARGLYREGDERLAIAEAASKEIGDEPARALLILQRQRFAWKRQNFVEARRLANESYEISKSLGDRVRMIPPLLNLGQVGWAAGDYDGARRDWEEALELARETGERRYHGILLSNLALLCSEQGDLAEAEKLYAEALSLHRRNDDLLSIAYTQLNSSDVLRRQGRHKEAMELLEQSCQGFTQLGQKHEIGITRLRIGEALIESDKVESAEQQIRAGLQIAEEINDQWCRMYGAMYMGRIWGLRGDLPAAISEYRRAVDITKETGERRHLADVLRFAGLTLEGNGREFEAYIVLTVAQTEYMGLTVADKEVVDAALNRLRSLLSAARCAEAKGIARSTNPSGALQMALASG